MQEEKQMEIIKKHRVTAILILSIIVLSIGGFFAYQKLVVAKNFGPVQEVDLTFDPEGPYALLVPRRDGNALILNLKRTSSYDAISYELAYVGQPDATTKGSEDGDSIGSGGIDRGVVGEIKTTEKKGEYEQEILFGTCSKNVCKYDKGVENGTLTLHIRKGNKAYRMVTQWHIQKPDVALGKLSSGDGHFNYSIKNAKREELSLIGYSIINDLTGLPKLPDGKEVFGKVYALNVPSAKDLMAGDISFELADKALDGAKLARYSDSDGRWIEMDTKFDGNTLLGQSNGAGVFAVLVPKK
jgi:hypothetical protein